MKIKIISNHFPVKIDPKKLRVWEWSVKIFSRENSDGEDQLELYKANPSSVKTDVELDARKIISEVFGRNKLNIYKTLGRNTYFTGMQIYSVNQNKNSLKEEYFFD